MQMPWDLGAAICPLQLPETITRLPEVVRRPGGSVSPGGEDAYLGDINGLAGRGLRSSGDRAPLHAIEMQ